MGKDDKETITPLMAVFHHHPRGWWFADDHTRTWRGPFPSAKEAEEAARKVIVDTQEEINLIEMQLWQEMVVEVKND